MDKVSLVCLNQNGTALISVGPFETENQAHHFFNTVAVKAYYDYRIVSLMTPEEYNER